MKKHGPLYEAAHILSVVFHPMTMPIYAMIYILYFNPLWSLLPSGYKSITMLYVSFGASILPLLALTAMIYFGMVGNPEMPNKSERVLPLAVSTIFVAMTCYYTHTRVELPLPMTRLIEGMFIMMLIAVIVTPMWKISLHSMGAGAMIAFVCLIGMASRMDFSIEACVVFLLAGLIGWARLYLMSHTPHQLMVGLIVGVVSMSIALLHR
ncbi:MAG: phosphatase PAP2 family protein [Bacteroidales bacterium]|nr:phosphatase PAP2 family protein [Bacteroidales bacterium]